MKLSLCFLFPTRKAMCLETDATFAYARKGNFDAVIDYLVDPQYNLRDDLTVRSCNLGVASRLARVLILLR